MIDYTYYVNQDIEQALEDTGLALDELELIVGRFRPHSCRAGLLRGEIVILVDGEVIIRHHFTKKILWRQE